jgi:glycosyltransferase involved in cell wall biosynthesis
LRILQISSAQALGGGEKHLADLTHALSARGHDVSVAVRHGSPLIGALGLLPKDRILTLPLRNALDASSAMELARIVRRRQIEIVHAHMARDYPLSAFATRRNHGARLILTRHVMFRLSRMHAVTLSNAARVIAVSGAVARRLLEQGLFAPDKIAVVKNGIDVERFEKARLSFQHPDFCRRMRLPANSLLVGTVGELTKLKGQEVFLRAAALVRERFANVHFVVAGQDTSRSQEHLTSLRKSIKELDLEDCVYQFGWLDDIAQLYCGLDVFVSASQSESFGLAMVEAMASGTPVVATTTDGAREIIEDGVTGLLVAIGDIASLAKAVIELLEDGERRQRLAITAQARARERFSLERMVSETERVYRDALVQNRSR